MSTITYTRELVVVTCWCGITHGIPMNLDEHATNTGEAVYCPLGHEWVRAGRLDRLKKDLDATRRREQANRDLLHAEERSHSATKGHLTRSKHRAERGICPHCTRTFANLARHVQSKHAAECAK